MKINVLTQLREVIEGALSGSHLQAQVHIGNKVCERAGH